MSTLPLFDDFETLVREQRPLIDTRAPVEFKAGAFPGAVNLPLMTDEERAAVGTCYKQQGNEAAVRLGHELVNEQVRRPRIRAWADFYRAHPDALLYCFRGGQRSEIAQRWLYEYEGLIIPRLRGGYKALRRFLIEQMEGPLPERLRQTRRFVIGGRTGCGKTRLLAHSDHKIDLEALANHRGSAFGRHIDPQPTQIDFENRLAYTLIQFLAAPHPYLAFEDEGRNVGRLYLPQTVHAALYDEAELLILEAPLETRVDITLDEYVVQAQARWLEREPENGLKRWREDIFDSMQRIQRRLGGERHRRLLEMFESAWQEQLRTGGVAAHRDWVRFLLTEYYDPMYDYQLSRKAQPVRLRGEAEALQAFLEQAATSSDQ